MPELIDAYVRRMRAGLERSLSPNEAQLVSQEVHAHLMERYEAYLEIGSDERSAERDALLSFGKADELVTEFAPSPQRVWAIGHPTGDKIYPFLFLPLFLSTWLPNSTWMFQLPWLNIPLVLTWLLYPALCRRHPWLGLLTSLVLIETTVIRDGQHDYPGIVIFVAITAASWVVGSGIRSAIWLHRTRRRSGRPKKMA